MLKRTRRIVIGLAALLLVGGLAAGALAARKGSPAAPITGDPLAKASRIALDHVGGGEVTQTELGDEEGYYEVEVTLADGRQVDVHLDRNFNILPEKAKSESSDDKGASGQNER